MGILFSKRTPEPQGTQQAPPQQDDNEDHGLQRIRKTLNQDLETFLLNNILLSVQFFENFEGEVKNLRDKPVSDGDDFRNKALEQHQRHCISPDRLYEVVRRRVLFRREHGQHSNRYELLHSPRLMVVQDNVEVKEPHDEAVYSTVMGTPNYRFVMEATTNHPGYMKLRAEECMLPNNRRATYETVKDEDEGVYTSIPSGSPNEIDSRRSTIQEQVVERDLHSSPPETPNLTERRHSMAETESGGKGPPLYEVQTTAADSRQTLIRSATELTFGPQNPNCDPNKAASFTPTERRLSGIMRVSRYVDARTDQKNRRVLRGARSTPNLATFHSPKNSGSSGYKSEGGSPNNDDASGSEYGYSTITELTTPRPLKENRLGNRTQNTSEIPEECFSETEVPVYDDEEDSGNLKLRKNLFETRYYLNSILYMRSFAGIFTDKIGASLGFTSALNSATTEGSKIYCDIIQRNHDSNDITIRNEIIPTMRSATWPEGLRWKPRKSGVTKDSAPGGRYSWPTQAMLDEMKEMYGCHLLPVGYIPTRGTNDEQYLEWQLAFPELERYLEARLTHAQVRCLLFSLALYKTFLLPLNTQLGLLPTHIRTVLFWQCERNYTNWPEDRPGEILRKFLGKLYDAIRCKQLEDYFIENRNLFESTPQPHLLKVQEKLLRIRENLVMHVLLALRNLRYSDTSFYPVLNYKQLYNIITCEDLLPYPQLQYPIINAITPKNKESTQQLSEEEEESDDEEKESNTDLWKEVTPHDAQKKWKQEVRAQIEIERVAQKFKSKAKALATQPRKTSTESINIKLEPKKSADILRKTALLEFFIPHFIEIARKSNHFKATQQARFYQKHAERLQKLLHECNPDRPKAGYYSKEFERLDKEMNSESTAQAFVSEQQEHIASRGTPTKTEKRKSVHFTQPKPSQNHIFNNVNPFRQQMALPQQNLHSPLAPTKTCDEQSQPNTNIVTPVEVHISNTSRTAHTLPSLSTIPEDRTDVTDAPCPSPTIKLTGNFTDESTDT